MGLSLRNGGPRLRRGPAHRSQGYDGHSAAALDYSCRRGARLGRGRGRGAAQARAGARAITRPAPERAHRGDRARRPDRCTRRRRLPRRARRHPGADRVGRPLFGDPRRLRAEPRPACGRRAHFRPRARGRARRPRRGRRSRGALHRSRRAPRCPAARHPVRPRRVNRADDRGARRSLVRERTALCADVRRGASRPADGPAEPPRLRRAPRGDAPRGAQLRGRCLPRPPRPGRLQARQRHPRPSRGRRGAAHLRPHRPARRAQRRGGLPRGGRGVRDRRARRHRRRVRCGRTGSQRRRAPGFGEAVSDRLRRRLRLSERRAHEGRARAQGGRRALRGAARGATGVSRDQVHERMESEAARTAVLTELSAITQAIGSITSEGGPQAVLDRACKQLTALLGATAAEISRLEGDVLRSEAWLWPAPYDSGKQEYGYLLGDYPLTREVLESGRSRAVSLSDEDVDAAEAFVLRELKMQAVLLLPFEVAGRTWGLIEVYDARPRTFSAAEKGLAELVIRQAAVLLEQCESREARDRLYRETLAALSNALEAKDGETSDHTQEVGELAIEVATVLGLPGDEVRHVGLGALLHDIGKIRVPESILLKAGPLTDEQWEVMRSHPEVGERILAPMQSLEDVLPIVRSSHERWDGRGYPDGLAGEAIPLGARIVAACDAYRAMVEHRPYRNALSRGDAIEEMRRAAGAQFDPDCVNALLEVLRRRSARLVLPALHRPTP